MSSRVNQFEWQTIEKIQESILRTTIWSTLLIMISIESFESPRADIQKSKNVIVDIHGCRLYFLIYIAFVCVYYLMIMLFIKSCDVMFRFVFLFVLKYQNTRRFSLWSFDERFNFFYVSRFNARVSFEFSD